MIKASEARKLVEQDELRNEALEDCKAHTEKCIKTEIKRGKTETPFYWWKYGTHLKRGKTFDFRDDMIRHLENHGYRVIAKYNTNDAPYHVVMW